MFAFRLVGRQHATRTTPKGWVLIGRGPHPRQTIYQRRIFRKINKNNGKKDKVLFYRIGGIE
jgi:hypothetical protein